MRPAAAVRTLGPGPSELLELELQLPPPLRRSSLEDEDNGPSELLELELELLAMAEADAASSKKAILVKFFMIFVVVACEFELVVNLG